MLTYLKCPKLLDCQWVDLLLQLGDELRAVGAQWVVHLPDRQIAQG
jgi:hypothetical protein